MEMNDSRKKMLERVKALLAKTIVNGCTEGETLAALAKARELMAAYEITESEVQPETEKAQIHPTGSHWYDPYLIKRWLAHDVAGFCRCRVWWSSNREITFCGLESDVIFATWLLDTLQQFAIRELMAFLNDLKQQGKPTPRSVSSSFVHGCTGRIGKRLQELTPVEPVGSGLVVSRNALIDAAMAEAGIRLSSRSSSVRIGDGGAYAAGDAAGNHANFSRPVEGGGGPRLIGGRGKRK
jgi:hypothetical protein